MLSVVCTELGEYVAAVKHGKGALRVASEHPEAAHLSFLCINMSYAYARLADFPKAQYWGQLHLELGKRDANAISLAVFYTNDGFVKMNQGDLQSGRQSLYKALTLIDERASAMFVGKIHLNLSEIAVQQGDSAACREHSEASQAAFASIQDMAEVAEAKSVSRVWELVYGRAELTADALSLVETLIEYNCVYSAARLLFHLILACPGIDPDQLESVIKPIWSTIRASSVPLFKSLFLLLEAVDVGGHGSAEGLGLLKQALRGSLRGQARFASLVLCRAIGKAYLERGQFRHAEKYLSQAICLAENLPNPILVESLRKLLDEIADMVSDQAPVLESFHGVSAILKEIAHTEESFRCLLQFALDQTGAERAVLLLRRRSGPDLYVAASLNCDSKSEEEITTISSGVAGRTIEQINPLIVDNALSDKRTRDYSSIVAHNVLSVACVPLKYGDQLQGVLYLDHATLPSLFSARDIKYVLGISNFLSTIIATVRAYRGLDQSNIQLRYDLSRHGDTGEFLTHDRNTLDLLERLPEIAHADVPVLIVGESGTGKEIICEMLHKGSRRSDRPLVKLNCAAIAETMVESELFGVASNVATGVAGRDGKLSAANGGTLLLDEIADMPLDTQAKLLRAIEAQQFEKVGSNRPIHTDIRFVCATNKDLIAMLNEGRFRQDLYYRINTIVIEIPPLRDRPDDIELLLDHFLRTFSIGRTPPQFGADIKRRLAVYHWPGNVRELKNFVERCCILHPGRDVGPTVFQDYVASSECPLGSGGLGPAAEKQLIRRTLHETGWNQSKAANLLRMPLTTLRRKIKKYGLAE
jgi:transcriptional regulator with GAF, ATPase, and Fis domain